MLDDTADIVEAFFRQTCIFVARKERLLIFPDRHMNMHACAVIIPHWFWHECRCFAVGVRDILDDIFIKLHVVAHLKKGVELHAELVLSRGHFMVMLFRAQAELFHDGEHFAAHVLGGVDWGNGEVAAFRSRAVAHIAASILLSLIHI